MSASKWKPYPEYKKTEFPWIDEIPLHWQTISVKHLFQLGRGRVISSGEIQDNRGEYPVYSSQTSNEGIMGHINTFDFEGDYLTWTTDGAHAGTVFSRTGRFNCTNVCGTLLPHISENLDLNYMQKCINSLTKWYVRHDINPKLMNDTMGSITIPLPPIKEQNMVGNYLSEKTKQITLSIQHLEHNLLLLEQKRLALITQAVTKGLNLDRPMKGIESPWIDSIPEDWTNLRINQIVCTKVTDGPHVTPVQVDEGVPFLSATAVENGRLNMSKMWGYISREDHELYCRKCLPQLEDIFMVKSGATTGSIAFVDFEDEFSVWSPLALIRCDRNKVHPRFVFYSLQSDYLQKAISQTWSKGTQENIAMGAIEELPILMPPLHEQIEISNYIDFSADLFQQIISKTKIMIEKLNEYQKSLVSAAVTGKIDVRSL